MATRVLIWASLACVAAWVLGIAGMWLFNPDMGGLGHWDWLWEVFGLAFYLSYLGLFLVSLGWAVWFVARLVRARRSRSRKRTRASEDLSD